jgi:hypothetical protein
VVENSILSELEQRIVSLETGAQYDVNKAAIERIEMDHLEQLREIRTALLREREGTSTNTTILNGDGNSAAMEALQKENDLLKKKMIKLEYRIQHLVSNMEVLYEKSSPLTSSR